MTRLFHLSEDGGIERFVPRPVAVPSVRPDGLDWLNGPLVWAVDDVRIGAYLFPRDCPRIVLWTLPTTTEADRSLWFGDRTCRLLAHVERGWLEGIEACRLWRYELPVSSFRAVPGDSWMQVSTEPVEPVTVEPVGSLLDALAAAGTDLEVLDDLTSLRRVWDTTLHASGIRLRNAVGWAG